MPCFFLSFLLPRRPGKTWDVEISGHPTGCWVNDVGSLFAGVFDGSRVLGLVGASLFWGLCVAGLCSFLVGVVYGIGGAFFSFPWTGL